MTVLIDSDVLIEVTRKRDDEVLSRWLELGASDTVVMYSPVTVAELWAGILPHEEKLLRALFEALQCAEIDEAIGTRAGAYLRKYQRSHNVQMGDALIAASAIQNEASLWTRNKKHFPMKDLEFF
ncbi:MAG TPA: type II toxin-antitoxin system VapC family toxin [Acidobacteriaceae bacterium]